MPNHPNTPWMDVALKFEGLKEIEGRNDNNEVIIRFYAEAGDPQDNDEVAWCSAFANAVFFEAALPQFMTHSLMAKSWLKAPLCDAVETKDARYGDIIILNRGSKNSGLGHVTFFLRWDGDYMVCLGGNQHDSVDVSRFHKSKLAGIRRPQYTPPTVSVPVVNPTKKYNAPSATATAGEVATVGVGGVAAAQSQDWIVGLCIFLVFAAIVGYIYWKRRNPS